jgi:hypothetical protein
MKKFILVVLIPLNSTIRMWIFSTGMCEKSLSYAL